MVRVQRWLVVMAAVLLLASLPSVLAARPVSSSSLSATALLSRINQSVDRPYSGYAESIGGLALPVTSQFTTLSDLFGGASQLRVWWRASRDWRVDLVSLAGESDVYHDQQGSWTWNYESNQAVRIDEPVTPEVRLPAAGDLLPPNLGRRLLSQATATELTRLPTERVAGHSAAGLRLHPNSSATSVNHVDVWADTATGIPLRVDVYPAPRGNPALSTSFLDFNSATPSSNDTAFLPSRTAQVRTDQQPDLATAINRFGDSAPPDQLAGFARNALFPVIGAIGVYGRGVTEFAAAPLPRRTASSLRGQLTGKAGITDGADGLSIAIGPLSLLLTPPSDTGPSWLLTGTVTEATLATAAGQLAQATGR
jgi:outer membrane lipoprotein-sorting protein